MIRIDRLAGAACFVSVLVLASPLAAQLRFLPNNVKLAKALPIEDATKSPGTFALLRGEDKWNTQLDAALYFQFPVRSTDWVGLAGVSAAAGSARKEDARVVQPVIGAHGPIGRAYLLTTSSLEATSDWSTRKLVFLSPLITATRVPALAWGEEQTLIGSKPKADSARWKSLEFRWRPYGGMDFGQVREAADSLDGGPQDTFVRGVLRVDARLRWVDNVSQPDRPRAVYDRVALTGTYWGRHLFASEEWQPYWTTSLTFYPDPLLKVGVTISYSEGHKPPTFAREQVVSLGLAVEQ